MKIKYVIGGHIIVHRPICLGISILFETETIWHEQIKCKRLREDIETYQLRTLLTHMAVCHNLVPLVNIKIAGKWMFIPLKMVLIGIDPYPYRIQPVNLTGLRYQRYHDQKPLCDPHSIHLAIHLWPRRMGVNPPLLLDVCSTLPQNNATFSYVRYCSPFGLSSRSCSFDCLKVKNAANHVCTCLHQ